MSSTKCVNYGYPSLRMEGASAQLELVRGVWHLRVSFFGDVNSAAATEEGAKLAAEAEIRSYARRLLEQLGEK